ncbi:hypothetical protein K504DRAFT_19508 [Pleomassaria siparia CBS 279.74]|uniref:Uncharacterized protein n=1 Tax=Pleomassaria siparia CBS 279.74 TaxID=1314801 RepID=A0A6G1KRM8_9PLEO|nr:hypothetical protein K504DRAFT_19508 [Pleomassaria siparia CBS 279.74]
MGLSVAAMSTPRTREPTIDIHTPSTLNPQPSTLNPSVPFKECRNGSPADIGYAQPHRIVSIYVHMYAQALRWKQANSSTVPVGMQIPTKMDLGTMTCSSSSSNPYLLFLGRLSMCRSLAHGALFFFS